MKGWVDRVFAYGRFYGVGRWYENGMGKGKRAMVVLTTGGGETMYGEEGMHPPLETILAPIHRGIFWFNGFSALQPLVAWSAAHGTDEDRREVLEAWRRRLQNVFEEAPLRFPKAADFDSETFNDRFSRFMVTLRRKDPADEGFRQLLPALGRQLAALRRDGRVLSIQTARGNAAQWSGYVLFRERSAEAVVSACRELALGDEVSAEIVRLAAEADRRSTVLRGEELMTETDVK